MAAKKASAGKSTTINFEFDRETKGTKRYAEQTEDPRPVIGTLYVRKDVAENLPDSFSIVLPTK